MSHESEVPIPSEGPRHCPACGTRVAAKATTCLMCGASLGEEEEIVERDEPRQRRIPGWVGSVVVALLALVILAAGGGGLYVMLSAPPEEVTPQVTPTPTPTVTPTLPPTQTPLPTSIPTPIPPRAHEVQEGETMSDIAIANDTTVEQILALNPDVDPELIRPGQILLIPASTSGATSAQEVGGSGSVSGDFNVHIVEAGETLISIAEQYGVSVSVILVANDLPPGEETIRQGQSLVIPAGTPAPTSTPTMDPNATSTPIPLYEAPALLGPRDGAVFTGTNEPVLLHWASVSVLRDDEWYELRLSQPSSGVVSDTVYTRATAWHVPFDLLEKTNDVRDFYWKVRVVRENEGAGGMPYEKAGVSSGVRTFTWLESRLTPSPSPTPTS